MGELVLRIKTSRKMSQSSSVNSGSRAQAPANSPPSIHDPVVDHASAPHNFQQRSHMSNEGYYSPPTRHPRNNSPPLVLNPFVHHGSAPQNYRPQAQTLDQGYHQPARFPINSSSPYAQQETVQRPHAASSPPPPLLNPFINDMPVAHNYHSRPEYVQPHYDTFRSHEPEYAEGQMHWKVPSEPTPPLYQSPEPSRALECGLPDSLRISMPAYRPSSAQRQRPASVSMTGTGYISRHATPLPCTEPVTQRPFASAPIPRPEAQERTSYGFSQDERAASDTRRATVGYAEAPQFDAGVGLGLWSTSNPPLEQPWIPRPALYSPVSPPDDFLSVSEHGHFRMPTPVNHGGQEFQHDGLFSKHDF